MKAVNPPLIGRKAFVDLPRLGILHVPAKVDTGADSSAIWASDIHEEDGELSFVLFDKTSPHYTGEVVKTREFRLLSIKNSFGATEHRYKVKLAAVLEGRKLNIQFTLANRSRNSQPILIGRKTLQRKFLVDVTRDPLADGPHRILFLSAKQSDNVAKMTKALEDRLDTVTIERATYDDLVFAVVDGMTTVSVTSTGRDIAEYDVIHFKTSVQRDITAAIARYATHKGVRILDDIVKYFPTTSKLYQYSILSAENILVPDSLFVTPAVLPSSFMMFSSTLGLPFVLKGIYASKGQLNEVIRTEADFVRVAKRAEEEGQYLIGQSFVPNTGDYRILVFGKQIALVIHRRRKDDNTHLNNTSTGGVAQLIDSNELPTQVQLDSIQAAYSMGRDIAGIDMVQDSETGTWYCFEVNDGPQLATGAFLNEKHDALAAYLRRELEK